MHIYQKNYCQEYFLYDLAIKIVKTFFWQAACCQLHIAALIAQYLKVKELQCWGAETFQPISSNIPRDEIALKLDSGWLFGNSLVDYSIFSIYGTGLAVKVNFSFFFHIYSM